MQVTDGIHRIEAPLGERRVCCFLIAGQDGVTLLDTGVAATPAETLLPYLAAVGATPDTVVISHADFDHHGGNAPIAAAFPHARFACHPADRAQIEDVELLLDERYGEFEPRYGVPRDAAVDAFVRESTTMVPIDVELRGGERLPVSPGRELEVLHVPGHSRGHLALWDPATRTAIVADAVLHEGLPTVAGAPAFPPTYRYVADYRATIVRLRGLSAERLLTSHFELVEGTAAVERFLDATARYADRVEDALLAELEGAPDGLTLPQLVELLGTRLGDWPDEAAGLLCHPLAGHVEEGLDQGTMRLAGHGPAFALGSRA